MQHVLAHSAENRFEMKKNRFFLLISSSHLFYERMSVPIQFSYSRKNEL